MARILMFGTTQIGDGVVSTYPAGGPQSQLGIGVAVFHDAAGLVVQERNYLHRQIVAVHYKAANEVTFARNVDTVMRLGLTRGTLQYLVDGDLKFEGLNWILEPVPPPRPLPGFGGRFIAEWELTFTGATALRWL